LTIFQKIRLAKRGLKHLFTTLFTLFVTINMTSCDNRSVEDKIFCESRAYCDNKADYIRKHSSDSYDVVCFLISFSEIKCNPESIVKVPRGSTIELRITSKISVQNGTQAAIKYDLSNDAKNISVSEMESLASNGASIYASKGRNEDEIWVYLFKSSTGKFELFNRQKDKMNFISGDTEIRIK
jgi:hypothetical protein